MKYLKETYQYSKETYMMRQGILYNASRKHKSESRKPKIRQVNLYNTSRNPIQWVKETNEKK